MLNKTGSRNDIRFIIFIKQVIIKNKNIITPQSSSAKSIKNLEMGH